MLGVVGGFDDGACDFGSGGAGGLAAAGEGRDGFLLRLRSLPISFARLPVDAGEDAGRTQGGPLRAGFPPWGRGNDQDDAVRRRTCQEGTMTEQGEDRRAAVERRLDAMRLQEIAGNPLDADDVAMFEMFEREGWSHERRRAHILNAARAAHVARPPAHDGEDGGGACAGTQGRPLAQVRTWERVGTPTPRRMTK